MDKPATFTPKDAIRAEKVKFWAIAQSNRWGTKILYPWSATIQAIEEKDISYRSRPNVDPESTTEPMLLVRSLLIAIASAVCLSSSGRKRLTQKGDHGQCGFKQMTPSLLNSLQPNVLTIYIQQTKVSHWASTEEVGETFSIAPIPLIAETAMQLETSQALWKINFWRFRTMTQPVQPLARKFVLHGEWLTESRKTMGRKWAPLYEYKLRIHGLTASMISLRIRSQAGFDLNPKG